MMTRLSVTALESRDLPSTLPLGFSETRVVNGLTNPTAMALAPDGDSAATSISDRPPQARGGREEKL